MPPPSPAPNHPSIGPPHRAEGSTAAQSHGIMTHAQPCAVMRRTAPSDLSKMQRELRPPRRASSGSRACQRTGTHHTCGRRAHHVRTRRVQANKSNKTAAYCAARVWDAREQTPSLAEGWRPHHGGGIILSTVLYCIPSHNTTHTICAAPRHLLRRQCLPNCCAIAALMTRPRSRVAGPPAARAPTRPRCHLPGAHGQRQR